MTLLILYCSFSTSIYPSRYNFVLEKLMLWLTIDYVESVYVNKWNPNRDKQIFIGFSYTHGRIYSSLFAYRLFVSLNTQYCFKQRADNCCWCCCCACMDIWMWVFNKECSTLFTEWFFVFVLFMYVCYPALYRYQLIRLHCASQRKKDWGCWWPKKRNVTPRAI